MHIAKTKNNYEGQKNEIELCIRRKKKVLYIVYTCMEIVNLQDWRHTETKA